MMEPGAVQGPVVATDLKTSIAGLRSGTVTEIRLSDSVFDEDKVIKQMQEFAEALEKNRSLTALYFDCWIGGDRGAEILGLGLEKNESMKVLSIQDTATFRLRNNRIQDRGAMAIAKALKNNSSLTYLSLNYNAIGTPGIKELLQTLIDCRTLKTLDLGNNSFDRSAADVFAEFLKANQSVEKLILDGNRVIGDELFVEKLFLTLSKENSTLKTLSLKKITFSGKSLKAIALLIQLNKSLIEILFEMLGNQGWEIRKKIQERLQGNSERKLANTLDHQVSAPQKRSQEEETALKVLYKQALQHTKSRELRENPWKVIESLVLEAKFDEALKCVEESSKFLFSNDKENRVFHYEITLIKINILIFKEENEDAKSCFFEMFNVESMKLLEGSRIHSRFIIQKLLIAASDDTSLNTRLAKIEDICNRLSKTLQNLGEKIELENLFVKFFLQAQAYPEAKRTLEKLLSINDSIPLTQFMLKEFLSVISQKLSGAIKINDLEEVKKLSALMLPNQLYPSTLHLVVEQQKINMLSALLDLKNVSLLANLGSPNLENFDPAVDLDDDLNLIVDEKLPDLLDVNARDTSGQTPLHYAVLKNSKEAVQILHKKGADVNATDLKGNTPLHLAILINSPILLLLLKLGADPNRQMTDGNTALHLAIRKRLAAQVIKELIDKGASRIIKNEVGKIPLHYMGENGQVDVLRLLLQKPIINLQDFAGNTSLHSVIQDDGSSELVEIFLKNGADINQKNLEGNTPLHVALSQRRSELIGLLLNYGAKLHILNENNETAFHLAAKMPDINVVDLLVPQAIKENSLHLFQEGKNGEGFTALQVAVVESNLTFIQSLTSSFKEYSKQDVGFLLNYKSSKASGGETALHLAVGLGNFSVVKFLVENGADCWSKNECGETPLALTGQRPLVRKVGKSIIEIKRYLKKQQIQDMCSLILRIFAQQCVPQPPAEILIKDLTHVLQQYYLKIWIKQQQDKDFAITMGKNIALAVNTAMKFNKDSNSLAIMTQNNNREQIQLALKPIIDEAYQNIKKPMQKSPSFIDSMRSSEISITQKGLYISRSKLYELKKKAFSRAIKEGIRYLFYVNLALVNDKVKRADNEFDSARTLFATLSPGISAAVCEISQNEKSSFKVGLAFSLVNILFQAIGAYEDRKAKARANCVVEAFQDEGNPDCINVDAIKAIAEIFFERFKYQIMQLSISIGTNGKLRPHGADGVFKISQVIVQRIGSHILNDGSKEINESTMPFVRTISGFTNSIGRSVIKLFGQSQNIKAKQFTPLIQRCLMATWLEDVGLDVSIPLDKSQAGKALTWQAGDILCLTGIRDEKQPEICYFREGFFKEEIGYCFASKAEINLREYKPYKRIALEKIEDDEVKDDQEETQASSSFRK